MGQRQSLLGAIRRKLAGSSCRAIDVAAGDAESAGRGEEAQGRAGPAEPPDERGGAGAGAHPGDGGDASEPAGVALITPEDMAAVKIQAVYRGHLRVLPVGQGRRALRALRGLVKLQALVRGFCVRRQVRAAMQCMQVLVRLQLKVRTRQLLRTSSRPAQLSYTK